MDVEHIEAKEKLSKETYAYKVHEKEQGHSNST